MYRASKWSINLGRGRDFVVGTIKHVCSAGSARERPRKLAQEMEGGENPLAPELCASHIGSEDGY